MNPAFRTVFPPLPTFACLILFAAPLTKISGYCALEKIQAFAGGTVTLPCRVNVSDSIPTVEWSKEGLDPNIIFLYRDGCETFEMKNPVFKHRTNLILSEVKDGNMALVISYVQLSDAGRYRCMVLRKTNREVGASLELVVGAVPEPKLSFVQDSGDGVTLRCEAGCWWPEPEVTFLDDQGRNISGGEAERRQDSGGCVAVTKRATVPANTSSVTCRVHQPQTQQTLQAEIYIPATCMCSSNETCYISIPVGIIVGLVLGWICAVLYPKFCKKVCYETSPEAKEQSHRSRTGGNAECLPLRSQANSREDPAAEEHGRENGTLRQMTEGPDEQRSKRDPVVCQPRNVSSLPPSPPGVSESMSRLPHQFPRENGLNLAASTGNTRLKSDSSPRKKDSRSGVERQHPAPASPIGKRSNNNIYRPAHSANGGAMSSKLPPAPATEETHSLSHMSLSESRPHPSGTKPGRTHHTLAHTTHTISAPTQNRFTVLADLPQD